MDLGGRLHNLLHKLEHMEMAGSMEDAVGKLVGNPVGNPVSNPVGKLVELDTCVGSHRLDDFCTLAWGNMELMGCRKWLVFQNGVSVLAS